MVIQLLTATACLLLVLSLPVAKTAIGATLRRWGCFTLLLAFAPSVFFGLLRQSSYLRGPWTFGRILQEGITILIVGGIAYAVLLVRKRFAGDGIKPQKRIAVKQPVERSSGRPDFLNFLRDELRRDVDGENDRAE